jgi:hypothetical protein
MAAFVVAAGLSACVNLSDSPELRTSRSANIDPRKWADCSSATEIRRIRRLDAGSEWMLLFPGVAKFAIKREPPEIIERNGVVIVQFFHQGKISGEIKFTRIRTNLSTAATYTRAKENILGVPGDFHLLQAIDACAAELEAAQKSERIAEAEQIERP